LARALASRLQSSCDVTRVGAAAEEGPDFWPSDLLSVPDAEVALAGADTVVCLLPAQLPTLRLFQGTSADVEVVVADSLSRALPLTPVKRVVLCCAREDDERERVMRASGAPLSVVSGGGDDLVSHLEQLTLAVNEETRRLPPSTSLLVDQPTSDPRGAVLSVQRLRAPQGWTAAKLAQAYFEWLPSGAPLVKTVVGPDAFEVRFSGVSALRLRRLNGHCTTDVEALEVSDGALVSKAAPRGVFEFRRLSHSRDLVTTLRGFHPSLPWLLYRYVQAPMHARVMRLFGEWLTAQTALMVP
jgi:hypothetical protein